MNRLDKVYKFFGGDIAYEQYEDEMWTYVDEVGFVKRNKLVSYAEKHPILTPAVDYVGQMFSRAEFWIEKNGVRQEKHWMIDLLNNPGFDLTRSDFLRSIFYDSVISGTAVITPVNSVGFAVPTKLRILNPLAITYPIINNKDYNVGNYDKYSIILNKETDPTKYKIKDLVFIRDLAITQTSVVTNGKGYKSRKIFTTPSRFESQLQVLYNTVLSLEAKEIILKTNGKELYSSKSGADTQMSNAEKDDVQKNVNNNFGLTKGRSRAIVAKAAVDWKSLHIAMRDLGLDESLKTDSDLILGALHIPKDIKALDLKKASYQNQKESIVAYYQNILQTKVDDFAESMTLSLLKDGEVLKGGYEHLPVMKYILDQKYRGIKELGLALQELQLAGVEWVDALELCGLDSSYTYNEETTPNGTKEEAEADNKNGDDGVEDDNETKEE